MALWKGSKAELVTALAAVLGLPFYLGYLHTAMPQFALYSGVAAAAMATGEFVETPHMRSIGLRLFLSDALLWALVIGVFGAMAYAAASIV